MREGAKLTGTGIFLWGVAILVVIVLSAMALFGFGLFNRGTANFRGKNEQIEKTKANGNYRIAAYDQFYNLCASVQDDEATIQNLEEELKTKPPQDRITQINASLTAVKSGRRSKINEYNADARKTATQGQFRASDLPYHLDATQETTCTA
jgi:hypothetical protein